MHLFGGQVRKHVDQAREQVAALISADPSEIIFTSCGTESDNMAIRGAVEAAGPRTSTSSPRASSIRRCWRPAAIWPRTAATR